MENSNENIVKGQVVGRSLDEVLIEIPPESGNQTVLPLEPLPRGFRRKNYVFEARMGREGIEAVRSGKGTGWCELY